MKKMKIIECVNCQIVNLPEEYRFKCGEVVIQRLGYSLIMTPKNEFQENLLNNETCTGNLRNKY